MPTRRAFLSWLGATVAVGAGPWRRAWAALEPVGIQLYTLRHLMRQDVERTLAAVAEIGYREVEFAGYLDQSPKRIRAILETNGLRAPAAHVGYPKLGDGWKRVLDMASEIGHRYVVTPWLTERQRTADGYKRAAEVFNQAGAEARERGISFGYHNHDFEFVPLGGRLPFDLLLDETDPTLVLFELDLFWITKAGHDPFDYFARYPGRFPLVHVKDMRADGAMVDVGDGRIDFGRVIARATQAGIRHYFVEHDNPEDPLGTAKRSFQYLRGL